MKLSVCAYCFLVYLSQVAFSFGIASYYIYLMVLLFGEVFRRFCKRKLDGFHFSGYLLSYR